MGKWRKKRVCAATVLLMCTAVLLAWCRAHEYTAAPLRMPVMGIVCPASEDDWKDEQYRLLEEQAQANGFDCMIMRTERTQQAQIDAIRALIVYRVDVIMFSPIVQSGWENVLREAEDAQIPVITVDRRLHHRDGYQAVSSVSFPYREGAHRAAAWLRGQSVGTAAELYGTLNASSAQEISRGFREGLEESELLLKYSLCGDDLRSRGREIMETFVQEYPDVTLVLAQNDAMALGAIDYLKNNGIQPGQDIHLAVFGGGEEIRCRLADGEVNLVILCDNTALAQKAVQTALHLLKDHSAPIQVSVPVTLLTGEDTV